MQPQNARMAPMTGRRWLALSAAMALLPLALAAPAQAGLLSPSVVDPGFEHGASGQKTDVDQINSRGWYEAFGNGGVTGKDFSEFEQPEDISANIPDDEGSGTQWGGLGGRHGGRLYQEIGAVDAGAQTYVVSGIAGRHGSDDFLDIDVELWATPSGFGGGDATDVHNNGTFADGVSVSETSLFGNTTDSVDTATLSVGLTVDTSVSGVDDGDGLWLAFADVSSPGDAASATDDSDQQYFDDVGVAIPEPASLALLGPAGLLMLRRSRRR